MNSLIGSPLFPSTYSLSASQGTWLAFPNLSHYKPPTLRCSSPCLFLSSFNEKLDLLDLGLTGPTFLRLDSDYSLCLTYLIELATELVVNRSLYQQHFWRFIDCQLSKQDWLHHHLDFHSSADHLRCVPLMLHCGAIWQCFKFTLGWLYLLAVF